jgi:hypothetical protein
MELKRKEFLVGAAAFAPFARTFAVPKGADAIRPQLWYNFAP